MFATLPRVLQRYIHLFLDVFEILRIFPTLCKSYNSALFKNSQAEFDFRFAAIFYEEIDDQRAALLPHYICENIQHIYVMRTPYYTIEELNDRNAVVPVLSNFKYPALKTLETARGIPIPVLMKLRLVTPGFKYTETFDSGLCYSGLISTNALSAEIYRQDELDTTGTHIQHLQIASKNIPRVDLTKFEKLFSVLLRIDDNTPVCIIPESVKKITVYYKPQVVQSWQCHSLFRSLPKTIERLCLSGVCVTDEFVHIVCTSLPDLTELEVLSVLHTEKSAISLDLSHMKFLRVATFNVDDSTTTSVSFPNKLQTLWVKTCGQGSTWKHHRQFIRQTLRQCSNLKFFQFCIGSYKTWGDVPDWMIRLHDEYPKPEKRFCYAPGIPTEEIDLTGNLLLINNKRLE